MNIFLFENAQGLNNRASLGHQSSCAASNPLNAIKNTPKTESADLKWLIANKRQQRCSFMVENQHLACTLKLPPLWSHPPSLVTVQFHRFGILLPEWRSAKASEPNPGL